jgi:hypothetical protein
MNKRHLISLLAVLLFLIGTDAYAQNVRIVTDRRTVTITTASSSGSVAAGAKRILFIFSADFVGTILGATFSGTTDYSFPIEAPLGDILPVIAYTRSAGSVRIEVIK